MTRTIHDYIIIAIVIITYVAALIGYNAWEENNSKKKIEENYSYSEYIEDMTKTYTILCDAIMEYYYPELSQQ